MLNNSPDNVVNDDTDDELASKEIERFYQEIQSLSNLHRNACIQLEDKTLSANDRNILELKINDFKSKIIDRQKEIESLINDTSVSSNLIYKRMMHTATYNAMHLIIVYREEIHKYYTELKEAGINFDQFLYPNAPSFEKLAENIQELFPRKASLLLKYAKYQTYIIEYASFQINNSHQDFEEWMNDYDWIMADDPETDELTIEVVEDIPDNSVSFVECCHIQDLLPESFWKFFNKNEELSLDDLIERLTMLRRINYNSDDSTN